MKKIDSAILVFLITMVFWGVVNTALGNKENEPPIKPEELKKDVLRRQQAIEYYYESRLTELQLRAQKKIELLDVVEKAAYSSLAAQAKVAEAVLDINGYRYSRQASNRNFDHGLQNTLDKAPDRFAIAQSRVVETKNDILADSERKSLRLEKQKKHALTVGLANYEERLIEENTVKPKPKPTHGVVTGILYFKENPSAIIDGTVVYNGDEIHGVKVVNIRQNNVEFEKNGKGWNQKVQETAEKRW